MPSEIDVQREFRLKSMAKLFSRLGTTRKLRIIEALLEHPDPVPSGTIAAVTGLTEAATSHNLSQLMEVGIVRKFASGKYMFYIPNRELLIGLAQFLMQGSKNETERQPEEV